MRAGGLTELGVERGAFRGVAPRTGARAWLAKPGANLLAAGVARAHLIRLRQAIGVRLARRAELTLTTHLPLDARLRAVERQTVANLVRRHAARLIRLSAHVTRIFARRSDDAAAVVAGGAVIVALAVDRAIRVEIAGARAQAQARICALGAERAAGVKLARRGWRRVADTEGSALTLDVARFAVPDLDTVGVRLALVVAFAVDAAEAVGLVAVAIELARAEAPGRCGAAGAGAALGRARIAGGAAEKGQRGCQRRAQKGHAVAGCQRTRAALLDVLSHAGTFIQAFSPRGR